MVAIPVGLIANELLTNCLKHAFAAATRGLVRIALKVHDPERMELTIADDGCGLPADFAPERARPHWGCGSWKNITATKFTRASGLGKARAAPRSS